MSIVSHPANDAYRNNFDGTFGPKPQRPNECRIYNTTCPTPELCRLGDPNAPCIAGETADGQSERKMTLEELKTELRRKGVDPTAKCDCTRCGAKFWADGCTVCLSCENDPHKREQRSWNEILLSGDRLPLVEVMDAG